MDDVSDVKRLEEQLLRAQRLESIGTLAGGIAHDLNNVLSPVLLCIGLARSCENEAARNELLDIIEQSALRGSELVRQVLAFARGVGGERVAVHPKHFAREIICLLRETFPKSIRLVYDLPNELQLVLGDATQLNQVLLNLCVNARDAMPDGGTIVLSGRNEHLDDQAACAIPGARPGDYVVLSVADTGPGIPASIQQRIFDPFFTTKPLGLGTGLGLATVRTIVHTHGGFITLDSRPGRGTTFHIHLPAHPVASLGDGKTTDTPAPAGRHELVLVVDDEQPVRDTVGKIVTGGGYRVVTAADGIEAVARFMAFGSEIKVVVTDLLMPRLDGPGAIRAIRKSYPQVRIVAMSGNVPDEIASDLHAAGIDRLVEKPFSRDQILRAIHEVLHDPADAEDPLAAHTPAPVSPA